MRIALAFGLIVVSAALAAQAQGKGRVLAAMGICTESVGDFPTIKLRKVDKSAHHNIVGPLLPTWDYTDATGRFKVYTPELEEGEWEFYNHSMTTKPQLGTTRTHFSRKDYSHRFTVAAGKVVDLGRYCVATQSEGEVFPDSDRVWNAVPKFAYMLVSANREVDIEGARKMGLEVVSARPDPPGRVSPLLMPGFIEPKVIRRPAAPKPLDFPR